MKDYPLRPAGKAHGIMFKESRTASGFSFKSLIVIFFLIITAMFFVYQRIDYISTERMIRRLVVEKSKIQTSILPLKLEERHLSRLAKVERTANEELFLYFPDKEQIIKLRVDKAGVKNSL